MSAATRRSLSIALAGSLMLVVPTATAAPSDAPTDASRAATAAAGEKEGITHEQNPQVPEGAV